MIDYKFDEPRILQDIQDYIDSTYDQHYAQGRIQTNEFIMSHLDTPDGFKLNVLKYVTRYGYKDGHNRKDLMKAIHYLIFMLCYHDRKYENKEFDIPRAKPNLLEMPYQTNWTPKGIKICYIDEYGNRDPFSDTNLTSDEIQKQEAIAEECWKQYNNVESLRDDDPIYQLNKEDMEDTARNWTAWDDALDSIERLESENRLCETRLEKAVKKYKETTKIEQEKK